MYNRMFFPHRLRMNVSYSEEGAYVPTFSRFRIPMRRRMTHKLSSWPCRPSQGAVVTGGHGGGRRKRKNPLRVEKGPRSAESVCLFPSLNHTIWHFMQIYYAVYTWYNINTYNPQEHTYMYEMDRFCRKHFVLFRSRIASRALGCRARRGPTGSHRASAGPGRGPWSVLWAFKVATSGKYSRDYLLTRWSQPGPCKPRTCL